MGYLGTAMTEAQFKALLGGVQQGVNEIKNTGSIQPMSAAQAGGAAVGAFAGLPGGSVPQPGTVPFTGPILTSEKDRPQIPNTPMSASAASAGSNPSINQYGGVGGGSYGPPATPDVNTVSAPKPLMSSTVYNPTSPAPPPMSASQAQQATPDYAAIAASRTAAALARKGTIAEQQKASLDRSFEQSNRITNDNRTLQDFQKSNSVNRFTEGKKTWDKGLVDRERELGDTASKENLLAQKGNIDALLADFQNATADEQIRIADELERADRAYKLDLARFEQDQSNWDKTYNQNQGVIDYNQDPNNPSNIGQGLNNYGQSLTNSLNELKLGDYSEEQKRQAQLFEQEIKTGKMTQEAAEYNLKELKDPKSATNQAKALDLQMKQLEAKNLPEQQRLELQQLKKQIAQIGVVHYKPQTALEIEADQLQIRKLTAEVGKLENPSDKPVTPTTSEEYQKNLQPQYDNKGKITNLQQLEDQIILSGMSEYEQYKSYIANGIPWTDPIPKK